MAHRQAVVEATPTLRRDMSIRELLSAVAAGQVALDCRERSIDIGTVWMGPDGVAVAGPWHPTGRRLDFLERRDIITTRLYGNSRLATELTTSGWRWFARLVRPLTAEEHERMRDAFPPLDPRTVLRWTSSRANFPRCLRTRHCPS